MQISNSGLEFIAKWEGCSLKIYKDIGGKLHIGYGHLIKPGEKFPKRISKERAKQILLNDVRTFENVVNSTVTVPLTQNQFDALVSFAYNTGPGGLKSLVEKSKLNTGNYKLLPRILPQWSSYTTVEDGQTVKKKNVGLLNRRKEEADLWGSPATYSEDRDDREEEVPTATKFVNFLDRAIDEIGSLFSSFATVEEDNLTKLAKRNYTSAIKMLDKQSSANKKLY